MRFFDIAQTNQTSMLPKFYNAVMIGFYGYPLFVMVSGVCKLF